MAVIIGNILISMHAYLRMFHLHDSEKMASFKKKGKEVELQDIEDLSQVPASSGEFEFGHTQPTFFLPQSPRKEAWREN